VTHAPPTIAILVLNYNGKSLLDSCLGSVLAQTGPEERVYLVDNGSTDGSCEYVAEHYGAVGIIRFDRNLGFAEAYNRAVTSIDEDVVVFLNNDVQVQSNWLSQLKSTLKRYTHSVAAYGSKILLYDNPRLVNHAGGRMTPIGGGIDVDFMKPDVGAADEPQFAGCVSGASMTVPRSLFLRLGGFDADFFAYFEDADYCWRAWLGGYQVLYVPSSRVHHKLSATMGHYLKPQRLFFGERNRVQTVLKNLEFKNAIAGYLVSCLYDLRRVMEFPRPREPACALAIIRANLWVLTHLPTIILKRRQIQRSRRVTDAFLVKHRLMTSLTEGLREFYRLSVLRLG